MTSRPASLSFILLTQDPHLHHQLEKDLKQASIPTSVTLVTDVASMHRATARRAFDGVIYDPKRSSADCLTEIQKTFDPSRTCMLIGSRGALRLAAGMVQAFAHSHASPLPSSGPRHSIEEYLDSKLGEFVREMKNGAGRNLHPMLMKAVERPLIIHALKETNGNQIQTAHLLGMNRNTLRKKITELRIPVRREKKNTA